MPAVDVVQLVHSTVERNREIPAVLDAYSQFVDSPIGPLELKNLGEVFDRIQDNLSQRFPEIAAKRAGNSARNDISSFLGTVGGDPDRVKQLLRLELESYKDTMVVSIAERFSRMSTEERRAVDATLRLIYRSSFEILFRADAGKQLASSGHEFERFFAAVKSESPTMRELRYENLIIEKAIFNKLILKAQDRTYFVWIPSFFAKEGAASLIRRVALPNEHIMLSRLRDLASQSRVEEFEGFLRSLTDNLGILKGAEHTPEEFADFFQRVGNYLVIPPVDLDDIYSFLKEESEKKEQARLAEEDRVRAEETQRQQEQLRKAEQFRQRLRPVAEQRAQQQQQQQLIEAPGDSVFLGKQMDFDQLVSAINRRIQEKEIPSQVKQIGDYSMRLGDLRKSIAIVGSSGSGRSTTLKRLLDGMVPKAGARRFFVIDQKGEHRGLAWKYGWKVYSFAADSQAQQFRVSLYSGDAERDAPFLADLLQEWFNEGSLSCSDQQRERIASIIRAGTNSQDLLSLGAISDAMASQPELAVLAQKLKKGLVLKSTFGRIFSERGEESSMDQSTIFDISGRGLRDPTTKEERQVISVILLRELARNPSIRDSIVAVEDALDRFKSDSLKATAIELIKSLLASGNIIVATSRSTIKRDFLNDDSVEIVHRLSGEKVIADELETFDSDVPRATLQRLVAFLPRGYSITSKYEISGNTMRTAAVRVDPLTFS